MISKYWTVIFRWWPDVPVYHALLVGEFKTRCGRPVSLHTIMPPDKHVHKFARPCKDCYPLKQHEGN